MKIKVNRNWYWRGGQLKAGEVYNMPLQSCLVLLDRGIAQRYEPELEVAAVAVDETPEQPKPKRRRRGTSPKRKANG